MKRIGLTLLVAVLVAFPLFSQNVNIPDANFLNALIVMGVDTNKDGQISIAEAEVVTNIEVFRRGISNLSGIEAFVNLVTLECIANSITNLDVSKNTQLKKLLCAGNILSSLDISKNILLEELYCEDNQLTSLDISNNNLLESLNCSGNLISILDIPKSNFFRDLNCNRNLLTNLDVTNAKINKLSCSNNQLTTLDVSNTTALHYLSCRSNQLSSLKNSKITHLFCDNNQLTSLDVADNALLNILSCSGNQLSSLDVSDCPYLGLLDCSNNQLANLDISNDTRLSSLACDNNQLSKLDISQTSIAYLSCNNNQLTSLDASNKTELGQLQCRDNQITNLNVSRCSYLFELDCSMNQLSNLDVTDCTKLTELDCSGNLLETLDISDIEGLLKCHSHQWGFGITITCSHLDLSNMPTLRMVCVNRLPFPDEGLDSLLNTTGSPNIYFTGSPYIITVDSIYQPDFIEVTSSEDGMIYLVPQNTVSHLGLIRALCIDSAVVVSESPANISFSGLDNGIYWLYASDSTGNLSDPKAITVMGVGLQQSMVDFIRLYPNPTNSHITIETEYSDHYSLEIISINGQHIFTGEMDGTTHQIDLSSFQKGVYFITIRSKDFVKTEKIIKL